MALAPRKIGNSYHLTLDDTSGTVIDVDEDIIASSVSLVQATVVFEDTPTAILNPVIYLDVPWLGQVSTTDNVLSGYRVPLLTGNLSGALTTTQVISTYTPNIEMQLQSQRIPNRYWYRITDKDGAVLDNDDVISVNLVFQYFIFN